MPKENGKLFILRYKSDGDNAPFKTYEKALDTIDRYPIVYTVLPESFRDKRMTLAFLKANGRYLKQENEIDQAMDKRERELRKENTYVSRKILEKDHKEALHNIRNNAVCEEDTADLGEQTKDADVLIAAAEADAGYVLNAFGHFELTPQNYSEKAMAEAIGKQPRLVSRLYFYWKDHIQNFSSKRQSVMAKFGLCNEPCNAELAFYTCLSVVEGKGEEACLWLFHVFASDADARSNPDHDEIFSRIFASLSADLVNRIVLKNYRFARYVSSKILDKELQKSIAGQCPIAGDILPNRAVLEYDLSPHKTEDEACEVCDGCGRCVLKYSRFR